MKRDRELRPGEQPFWNVRGTQRRQRVANGGESMTGKPRNARLTETRENVRATTAPNFASRRSPVRSLRLVVSPSRGA
jgi:hypothetical protein